MTEGTPVGSKRAESPPGRFSFAEAEKIASAFIQEKGKIENNPNYPLHDPELEQLSARIYEAVNNARLGLNHGLGMRSPEEFDKAIAQDPSAGDFAGIDAVKVYGVDAVTAFVRGALDKAEHALNDFKAAYEKKVNKSIEDKAPEAPEPVAAPKEPETAKTAQELPAISAKPAAAPIPERAPAEVESPKQARKMLREVVGKLAGLESLSEREQLEQKALKAPPGMDESVRDTRASEAGVKAERDAMQKAELAYLGLFKELHAKRLDTADAGPEVERLRELESAYQASRVAYASALDKSVRNRLLAKGATDEQIEHTLARYNRLVRYNEIVRPGAEKKLQARYEGLDARGQSVFTKALEWSSKRNQAFEKWIGGKNRARIARAAIGAVTVSAGAAAFGHLAAGALLGYAGLRFGRSVFSAFAGGAIAERVGVGFQSGAETMRLKNLVSVEERGRSAGALTAESLAALDKERLTNTDERALVRKTAIVKALTAIGVGAGAASALAELQVMQHAAEIAPMLPKAAPDGAMTESYEAPTHEAGEAPQAVADPAPSLGEKPRAPITGIADDLKGPLISDEDIASQKTPVPPEVEADAPPPYDKPRVEGESVPEETVPPEMEEYSKQVREMTGQDWLQKHTVEVDKGRGFISVVDELRHSLEETYGGRSWDELTPAEQANMQSMSPRIAQIMQADTGPEKIALAKEYGFLDKDAVVPEHSTFAISKDGRLMYGAGGGEMIERPWTAPDAPVTPTPKPLSVDADYAPVPTEKPLSLGGVGGAAEIREGAAAIGKGVGDSIASISDRIENMVAGAPKSAADFMETFGKNAEWLANHTVAVEPGQGFMSVAKNLHTSLEEAYGRSWEELLASDPEGATRVPEGIRMLLEADTEQEYAALAHEYGYDKPGATLLKGTTFGITTDGHLLVTEPGKAPEVRVPLSSPEYAPTPTAKPGRIEAPSPEPAAKPVSIERTPRPTIEPRSMPERGEPPRLPGQEKGYWDMSEEEKTRYWNQQSIQNAPAVRASWEEYGRQWNAYEAAERAERAASSGVPPASLAAEEAAPLPRPLTSAVEPRGTPIADGVNPISASETAAAPATAAESNGGFSERISAMSAGEARRAFIDAEIASHGVTPGLAREMADAAPRMAVDPSLQTLIDPLPNGMPPGPMVFLGSDGRFTVWGTSAYGDPYQINLAVAKDFAERTGQPVNVLYPDGRPGYAAVQPNGEAERGTGAVLQTPAQSVYAFPRPRVPTS